MHSCFSCPRRLNESRFVIICDQFTTEANKNGEFPKCQWQWEDHLAQFAEHQDGTDLNRFTYDQMWCCLIIPI